MTAPWLATHRAHAGWWREMWWSALDARIAARAAVPVEVEPVEFVLLVPGYEIDSDSTDGSAHQVVEAARAHGWLVRCVRSCHADVKGFHELVTVRFRRGGPVGGVERGYGAWQDGRFARALLVHPGGRWETLGWARATAKRQPAKRALLDVIEGFATVIDGTQLTKGNDHGRA